MGEVAGVSEDVQLANQRWLMMADLVDGAGGGPIPPADFRDMDGKKWRVDGSVDEVNAILNLRRYTVTQDEGFNIILSQLVKTSVDTSSIIVRGHHRFGLEASARLSFMDEPFMEPRVQNQPSVGAKPGSMFVVVEGLSVPNTLNNEENQPRLVNQWFNIMPGIVKRVQESRQSAK